MTRLKSILHVIDTVSDWSGKAVSFLVVPMVLVLLYEIASRYIFNSPTLWAHEVSRHIYGAFFMLGGAYVLLYRGHVITDAIVGRLSPKSRGVVDAIFWIVFFFYITILIWRGSEMAFSSVLRQETTITQFKSPVWPVKLTIPIGAFLILMQGIAEFVRHIFTAVTGRRLA